MGGVWRRGGRARRARARGRRIYARNERARTRARRPRWAHGCARALKMVDNAAKPGGERAAARAKGRIEPRKKVEF